MSKSIAVVGATGLVGTKIIEILQQRNFEVSNIRFFASARSATRKIRFYDDLITVEDLAKQTVESLKGIDIAIFSAGGGTSKQWAPIFAEAGAVVVDNSSAWRQNDEVPLIVAGVNNEDVQLINDNSRIIANPNCTTMAFMPIIKPLLENNELESLTVSTYQACSGAGIEGLKELRVMSLEALQFSDDDFVRGKVQTTTKPINFPEPIGFQPVPKAGNYVEDGTDETDEEQKLRFESSKILHLPNLRVSGTCVRVPSFTGHCLSISARFKHDIFPSDVIETLRLSEDVIFADEDDPKRGIPTPRKAAGIDPTIIGRIRQDFSLENPNRGISFFVASDNIRLGAALNAVKIAELL